MASDPLTLFHAAHAAYTAEEWLALARLCDAASLAAFRDQLVLQYTRELPSRTQLIESYAGHSPGTPRDVVEQHVDLVRRPADERLRSDLPGVGSVQLLLELSPAEVFAAWMQSQSPRSQIEQGAAAGHAAPAAADAARAALQTLLACVALGVVFDGDRIAHVIYRPALPGEVSHQPGDARAGGDDPLADVDLEGRTHVSALLCRRAADGQWHLVADTGLFGLGFLMYQLDDDGAADE
jgi:hypothetical protein